MSSAAAASTLAPLIENRNLVMVSPLVEPSGSKVPKGLLHLEVPTPSNLDPSAAYHAGAGGKRPGYRRW